MAVWEYSHNNSTEITQKCQSCFGHSFFSRFSDLVYAAGRKEKRKKNTLSTRWCSFWVPLNTRGALHARHTAKNTHWTRQGAVLGNTEHERVPYTHATRCTQRYKSTYTHWKDVIHYTKMYNYPSHADVKFGAFRCYVLLNASGCISSSLLCGGVW